MARSAWGHGYAIEAARASARYGFTDLGLDEIVAMIIPANDRSEAVARRLGMAWDPAEVYEHPQIAAPLPGHRFRLFRLGVETWRENERV